MKTLHLDIFSGISGDMFLGALIDLGVDFATLENELRKLSLPGYHLHWRRSETAHIAGVKFDVHEDSSPAHHLHHAHDHPHATSLHEHHHHQHHHDPLEHLNLHVSTPTTASSPSPPASPPPLSLHNRPHNQHRTFASIRELIQQSQLSPWVKQRSVAAFARIARAEGKVHGLPPDEVHFHEVGAIDSIIDIVGACIALELLGHPRVMASPVQEGTGFLNCAHGRYPLPGPATLAILGERGIAVSQCDEPQELVTPTGAALLAEFAESFGPMQNLVASRIGFGLGTRQNHTRPNVLRAILTDTPDSEPPTHDWETDTIAVLETNLDDVSAEVLGHFIETALAAGALDVFHTPIQMKKSRPGVLLSLLCTPAAADRFTELILRETSAFGVRRTLAERRKLRREMVQANTPWGEVGVKLGRLNGRVIQAAPEFEDCRRVAVQAGVPLKEVLDAAIRIPPDNHPTPLP